MQWNSAAGNNGRISPVSGKTLKNAFRPRGEE